MWIIVGGIRDAQDLAAKSLKKKLRVKFSSQEDNLVSLFVCD